MLRISYNPSIWKLSTIIVILKYNKPKYEITSYRFISLLPTLAKLFEKFIRLRILCHQTRSMACLGLIRGNKLKKIRGGSNNLKATIDLWIRVYKLWCQAERGHFVVKLVWVLASLAMMLSKALSSRMANLSDTNVASAVCEGSPRKLFAYIITISIYLECVYFCESNRRIKT